MSNREIDIAKVSQSLLKILRGDWYCDPDLNRSYVSIYLSTRFLIFYLIDFLHN